MKQKLASLLLALTLIATTIFPAMAVENTAVVSGSYNAGVVSILGEGFEKDTAFSMISIKDSKGNLIALGSVTTDNKGSFKSTITTGVLKENTYKIFVYKNKDGNIVSSGDIKISSDTTKPDKPTGLPIEQNGKYKVYVKLMHENGSQTSMGDSAFKNNRYAYVTTNDGVYSVEVGANPVVIADITAGLGMIQCDEMDNLYVEHSTLPNGEEYVNKFSFTTDNLPDYFMITVTVPGSPMSGEFNARLVFNWKNAQPTTDSVTPNENPGSGSLPSDFKGDLKPTTDKPTIDNQGNASINVSTEAKVDSNGNATVNLDKSAVEQAISDIKNATKDKKDAKKEVILNISTKKAAKKIEASLDKTTLEALRKNVDKVKLATPLAELTFNSTLMENLASEKGNDVKISAQKVDISKNTKLSKETAKLISDRPVVDFSISLEGKKLSNFSDYITISVPYTLKNGENPRKLSVLHLDEKGVAKEIQGAKYDSTAKKLVFKTNHFSTFAVAYDENKAIFKDVAVNAWYADAVNFVVKSNLFSGVTEDSFAPDMPMTRSMLVTVLYRMAGSPDISSENKFTDVAIGQWYSKAVLWAKETGIVNGYDNGFFGTNDAVTREQMVSILYKYASKMGQNTSKQGNLTGFTDDMQVSDYATTPLKWAVSEKLISGTTATTISPKGNSTRGEVAMILMRFMQK